MTNDIRPILEIALQKNPVYGWVIMANWSSGEVEQLVGVYATREAAEAWVAERYDDWLVQATTRSRDRIAC